jgi:alkylation response protein AidB-like acyl-CoA dehydrogenase
MIALVRTSGSAADRHVGRSQLIVDLHAPGVTIRPITDLTGDAHFAEVFLFRARTDRCPCSSVDVVGERIEGDAV